MKRAPHAWVIRAMLLTGLLLAGGCSGPDGIVRDAADAAQDGDKEAYLACFTGRSQAMLRAIWQIAGDQQGKAFQLGGGGSDGIKIVDARAIPAGRRGAVRAVVTVAEGTEVVPMVVHRIGTQWRIDVIDSERMQGGGLEALFDGTP